MFKRERYYSWLKDVDFADKLKRIDSRIKEEFKLVPGVTPLSWTGKGFDPQW